MPFSVGGTKAKRGIHAPLPFSHSFDIPRGEFSYHVVVSR
jgi:hypothetical protein